MHFRFLSKEKKNFFKTNPVFLPLTLYSPLLQSLSTSFLRTLLWGAILRFSPTQPLLFRSALAAGFFQSPPTLSAPGAALFCPQPVAGF